MGERLKGKAAVVTGAGRGIGRGVALALAEEGAKVVVNDLGGAVDGSGISQAPADEVVAEIRQKGGEAVANYNSVAEYDEAEKIIKACVDNFGKIDILVNNAGILRDRMIFNMTPEEWDTVIKVHLYGTFNCTRHACVYMRQQRSGRIISMSSSSGLIGNPGQANYGAAKAGIAGFTRVVARDLGRYGITANAIGPGAMTRMVQGVPDSARQKKAAAGIATATTSRPIGTIAKEPEDVAPIVVYLCTDAASDVNGQVFGASGGRIALHTHPVEIRSIHKIGRWTLDELEEIAPQSITQGLVNPAPPKE